MRGGITAAFGRVRDDPQVDGRQKVRTAIDPAPEGEVGIRRSVVVLVAATRVCCRAIIAAEERFGSRLAEAEKDCHGHDSDDEGRPTRGIPAFGGAHGVGAIDVVIATGESGRGRAKAVVSSPVGALTLGGR